MIYKSLCSGGASGCILPISAQDGLPMLTGANTTTPQATAADPQQKAQFDARAEARAEAEIQRLNVLADRAVERFEYMAEANTRRLTGKSTL